MTTESSLLWDTSVSEEEIDGCVYIRRIKGGARWRRSRRFHGHCPPIVWNPDSDGSFKSRIQSRSRRRLEGRYRRSCNNRRRGWSLFLVVYSMSPMRRRNGADCSVSQAIWRWMIAEPGVWVPTFVMNDCGSEEGLSSIAPASRIQTAMHGQSLAPWSAGHDQHWPKTEHRHPIPS